MESPSPSLITLKKRRDFLDLAQKGEKYVTPSLVMQSRLSPDSSDCATIRVGFTVTKKLGNAVARNRIKRRLREAARQIFPLYGKAGLDYVVIGRNQTQSGEFSEILNDMRRAAQQLTRRVSQKQQERPAS